MVSRLIKGVILATLAGLASACTHHVPLEASWSYAPSQERAPPGVPKRGPATIGTQPSNALPSSNLPSDSSPTPQQRAINRLNEKIDRLERDNQQLSAEIRTLESQDDRDPPAMFFSLHNPSQKEQIIRCVYLAFQDLAADMTPPQDCEPATKKPQETLRNNGTLFVNPGEYVFLRAKLTLRPGDTFNFQILHADCPVPTHLLLVSDGKDTVEVLKEFWTRKRQTVLVHGEFSDGYIRDAVRRHQGAKGTGC